MKGGGCFGRKLCVALEAVPGIITNQVISASVEHTRSYRVFKQGFELHALGKAVSVIIIISVFTKLRADGIGMPGLFPSMRAMASMSDENH